jgi:hypothetical protein
MDYYSNMQAYYAPFPNPDPKLQTELVAGFWVPAMVDPVADVIAIPGIINALRALYDKLDASPWSQRSVADWKNLDADQNAAKTKADSVLIQGLCKDTSKAINVPMKHLMHALRVAITGKANGPSLYDAMAIMGKTRCLQHLTYFCDDNA